MQISLFDQWRLVIMIAADADLSATAARVGVALLGFRNMKSGLCNPSFETLGAQAGLKRRATILAVQELEQRGWITLNRRGGRHLANTYSFAFERIERVHSDALFNEETVHGDAPFTAEKGARNSTKRCTVVHPNYRSNSLGLKPQGGGALARPAHGGGAGAPRRSQKKPSLATLMLARGGVIREGEE